MKQYKRDKNRSKSKVIKDVNDTSKIVREDVYDLIRDTKTREEANEAIAGFVDGLNVNVHKQYKNKRYIYHRIASDIVSYGINWEE